MARILLVLIMCVGLETSLHAAWHRAESDNFIVYMDSSERAVRQEIDKLERFRHLLLTLQDIEPDPDTPKFRVFVMASGASVRRLRTGSSRGRFVGFYNPSARGSYTVVPRRGEGSRRYRLEADTLLFHEYAHHFMFQYLPSNYPSWYVEGFAEFWGHSAVLEDGRYEIGLPAAGRVPELSRTPWTPLNTFLSGGRSIGLSFYGQAWLVVHFSFFDREATITLRNYLNALQQGNDPEAAYAETFGASERDYGTLLREYYQGRQIPGQRITLATSATYTVELREIGRAELRLALLYAGGGDEGLEDARGLVRRYPDQPLAHVELARLRLEHDDDEGALVAAEQALALDDSHIEANVYKALALIALAREEDLEEDPRWLEARNHAIRANNANPNFALALSAYYQSFADRSGRPDIAGQALERAFQLAPQSPDVRRLIIDEYLIQRRFAEARRAIVPLLRSGHGQEDEGSVAAMLEQLENRIRTIRSYDQNGGSDPVDDSEIDDPIESP